MSLPICVTCGVQFEAPRDDCPVCEDARQWVPQDGQQWTTLEEVRASHSNAVRPEGGLTGIGTEPRFAIGQRALLVPHADRNLLWDCITLLDDATVAAVEARGGLSAIAISHPHYYATMIEWARRFDVPVYLHEADREWALRGDPRLTFWSGSTHDLGDGLTLIRCGGHFAGGTVLHRPGDLLSGDIVQVIPDRGWVSFMYSYPNLIPLPEASVRAIATALEPFDYERIYGAWWDTVIHADGKRIVRRSAERYIRALHGNLP